MGSSNDGSETETTRRVSDGTRSRDAWRPSRTRMKTQSSNQNEGRIGAVTRRKRKITGAGEEEREEGKANGER